MAGMKWGVDETDITGPAANAAAVTPSDSVELADHARSLYVGTGGNLVVTMVGGQEGVFYNVPTGTPLPIRVKAIRSTSLTAGSPTVTTTASQIVALW